MGTVRRLIADSSGATAVEYALIVAAIAAVIAAVVFLVGRKVSNMYENANTAFS